VGRVTETTLPSREPFSPPLWTALLCLTVASCPTHAHHSVLAYDGSTPTTITGTVVKVLWQNPHAYFDLDVTANGTRTRWIVENEGPVALERLGWTKNTLRAGDAVTVIGARARDGRARMRCASVTPSGARRLPCFAAGGT
jgi:hypothetical protein